MKQEIQYTSAVGTDSCEGCSFSNGILGELKWEGKHLKRGKLTNLLVTCTISPESFTRIVATATFLPKNQEQPTKQTTNQEVPPMNCHKKLTLYPNITEPESEYY